MWLYEGLETEVRGYYIQQCQNHPSIHLYVTVNGPRSKSHNSGSLCFVSDLVYLKQFSIRKESLHIDPQQAKASMDSPSVN